MYSFYFCLYSLYGLVQILFLKWYNQFFITSFNSLCLILSVHYSKIIHRDIKPANLLLDDNDHIKVTFYHRVPERFHAQSCPIVKLSRRIWTSLIFTFESYACEITEWVVGIYLSIDFGVDMLLLERYFDHGPTFYFGGWT